MIVESSSHLLKCALGDPDVRAVEPGKDKALESFAIGTTVIAEKAEGMLFPKRQTLGAIGSRVHTRRALPR